MVLKSMKSLLVATFGLISLFSLHIAKAQDKENPNKASKPHTEQKKSAFDANEVIFGHIMDAHEFHFFSYKGNDGTQHHASIPLPVISYSPHQGFSCVI